MKPGGGSKLNPNAAPYVPRSQREGSQGVPNVPNQGMRNVQDPPQISMPKNSKTKKDEDIDMELEYLIITFSDLSHDSIYDVYLANNCDLDDTIEMITQLEILSSEATHGIGDVPETTTQSLTSRDNAVILPDTLGSDIGDVTETWIYKPLTSTANASNEASSSSSSASSGIPKDSSS